jgi:hypothetical protein
VSFAGSGESTGGLASVVVAQCAPGRIAEATAWGVDILSHASKVTGLDGSSSVPCTGPRRRSSGSAWPRLMGRGRHATASLAADATYLERIDDAGPLFLPGSASQRLLRRLA